jgi:hypothetical protein
VCVCVCVTMTKRFWHCDLATPHTVYNSLVFFVVGVVVVDMVLICMVVADRHDLCVQNARVIKI